MKIEINNTKYSCWLVRLVLLKSVNYYTLVYGEDYTPLTKDKKIILFSEMTVLKMKDFDTETLQDKIEVDLNFPLILETILYKEEDLNAIILTAINLIDDFFINNIPVLDNNKRIECFKVLNPFADFLTFQINFKKEYIKDHSMKMDIYSSFCYLIGCFTNHLIIEDNSSVLSKITHDS